MELLTWLKSLDPQIARLGKELDDRWSAENASALRAAAWLNAWLAFGGLVCCDAPLTTAMRQTLLLASEGDEGESTALDLLLRVYGQMRDAARTSEPLRENLQEAAAAPLVATQSQWFAEDDRGGVKHGFYIPSSLDLIGGPHDPPVRTERQILTLWALVNRQLDIWSELAPNGNLTGTPDAPPTQSLAGWLAHVSKKRDLLVKFDGAQPSGSSLAERIGKLGAFVRFRTAAASSRGMSQVITHLAGARLGAREEMPPALADLIDASKPLGGEQLYPAGVWLRYVELLSYQSDGARAISESNYSLAAEWKARGLHGSWQRARPRGPVERPVQADRLLRVGGYGPALRWNAWPPTGDVADYLADTYEATLAYLASRRGEDDMERARFTALVSADGQPAESFRARLGSRLRSLEEISSLYLKRTLMLSASPGGRVAETPTMLAWRSSVTASEQESFERDRSVLVGCIAGEVDHLRVLHEAYSLSPRSGHSRSDQIAAAIWSTAGGRSLSTWSPYAMPPMGFGQCQVALNQLVDNLQAEIERGARHDLVQRELLTRFDHSTQIEDAAELDLAAYRLGRQVAEKAIQISKLYRQIDAYQRQIEELELKIAQLGVENANDLKEAAGVAHAYAARAAQLASSQLAAIQHAADEAQRLADDAARQIAELKPQLEEAARNIQDQKARERGLGILKAVVAVVGVVLAPFTGGASLAAIALANKAIDVADKLSATDWGKFESAAAAIGGAASDVGSLISTGIKTWGTPTTQADWAEFQGKFKSWEKDGKSWLAGKGKPFADAFAALKKSGDTKNLRLLVSAIGGGAKLSYAPEVGLRLDSGSDTALIFQDPGLNEALGKILDAGGIFVTNVQDHVERVQSLLVAKGNDLRDGLNRLIDDDDFIRIAPPELLAFIDKAQDAARAEVAGARALLKKRVGQIDDAARAVLAQAMAGGSVLMKDTDGHVRAFRCDVQGEALALRAHAKSLAEALSGEALRKVVDKLKRRQEEIQALAAKLSESRDEQGLRELAGTLPQMASSVREDLDGIRAQVGLAMEEVERSAATARAASLLLAAATRDVEIAAARASIASIRIEQADVRRTLLDEQLEAAQLLGMQAGTLESAAEVRLQLARADVRRAYYACLAQGIDPLSGREVRTAFGVNERPGILSVMGLSTQRDLAWFRIKLDEAGGYAVGMIQWINVLLLDHQQQDTGPGVADYYAQVVSILGSDVPLESARRIDRFAALKSLGSDMAKRYQRLVKERVASEWITHKTNNALERVSTEHGVGEDALPAGLVRLLRPSTSPNASRPYRVLARFRVSAHDAREASGNRLAGSVLLDTIGRDYVRMSDIDVVIPNAIELGLNSSDIAFVIEPPRVPRVGSDSASVLARPLSGRAQQPDGVPKKVLGSWGLGTPQEAAQKFLGVQFEDPDLIGARGDWTFYLVSWDPEQLKRFETVFDQVNIEFRMLLLHIRP